MKTVRIFHYLASVIPAVLLLGCDAPRDNPLDPGGDNYVGPGPQMGSIRGRVTNLGSVSIPGALVLTMPGYRGDVTDNSGSYLIEDVAVDTYLVFCSPEGFDPDTQEVAVQNGVQSIVDFHLDALPIISSFQVTSHYIYQGPLVPPAYYVIAARSRLADPDGFNDIAEVILEVEGGLDTTMIFNPDSSSGSSLFYFIELPEDFFPGASIDSIKWKKFSCVVVDTSENIATSTPIAIQRFFEDYPFQISPVGITITTQPFDLEWAPFGEQFYFTYSVHVFKQGYSTPLWQMDGIAPSATSVAIGVTLDDGTYNWTLEVFDEYGNSSRTSPATFYIQ